MTQIPNPRNKKNNTPLSALADMLYPSVGVAAAETAQNADQANQRNNQDQMDSGQENGSAYNLAKRIHAIDMADNLYGKNSDSDKPEEMKQDDAGETKDTAASPHSAPAVKTPTPEQWDEVVGLGGRIPKLLGNGKLLYGNSDKEYEKLTGIKDGISQIQQKLGLPVTGRFDKATYHGIRKAFVAMILPSAEAAQKKYGVPVEVSVGQALLESGNGLVPPTAADGKKSYNLYGMKSAGDEDSVVSRTEEQNKQGNAYSINAGFKAYPGYQQSVMDHARFLHRGSATFHTKNPKYDLMVRSTDPKVWAAGLDKAGYATAHGYGHSLLNSMNTASVFIREIKKQGR